jgi:hypothetical protein
MRLPLPDVQVERVASNAVHNLLRREADLAVRMVQPEQATVIVRRVGKVTLRACAPQDYPRRRGKPRRPTDLLEHDLIGGGRNDETLRGFAAEGPPVTREQFAFTLECDETPAVVHGKREQVSIRVLAVAQQVRRVERTGLHQAHGVRPETVVGVGAHGLQLREHLDHRPCRRIAWRAHDADGTVLRQWATGPALGCVQQKSASQ